MVVGEAQGGMPDGEMSTTRDIPAIPQEDLFPNDGNKRFGNRVLNRIKGLLGKGEEGGMSKREVIEVIAGDEGYTDDTIEYIISDRQLLEAIYSQDSKQEVRSLLYNVGMSSDEIADYESRIAKVDPNLIEDYEPIVDAINQRATEIKDLVEENIPNLSERVQNGIYEIPEQVELTQEDFRELLMKYSESHEAKDLTQEDIDAYLELKKKVEDEKKLREKASRRTPQTQKPAA